MFVARHTIYYILHTNFSTLFYTLKAQAALGALGSAGLAAQGRALDLPALVAKHTGARLLAWSRPVGALLRKEVAPGQQGRRCHCRRFQHIAS